MHESRVSQEREWEEHAEMYDFVCRNAEEISAYFRQTVELSETEERQRPEIEYHQYRCDYGLKPRLGLADFYSFCEAILHIKSSLKTLHISKFLIITIQCEQFFMLAALYDMAFMHDDNLV